VAQIHQIQALYAWLGRGSPFLQGRIITDGKSRLPPNLKLWYHRIFLGREEMKIGLIGYGKMGQEVEKAALGRGHQIGVRIDPAGRDQCLPAISAIALAETDVAIEFSHPDAVLENLRKLIQLKKPAVVGTTGWLGQIGEIRDFCHQQGSALVYAPNFSLGVNLFYRILEKAAQLFNHFDAYDVALMETHHRHKVDSPSGTAQKMAGILLQNLERKKKITSDALDRAIAPDELHLVSVRAGEFPGTHNVVFDSLADTIELTHTARSRAGFALGAVLAAEWVKGRQGVYSFEQVLNEILGLG
jgi:4-hydroxy-tetrahydrodipicolinate reductase